jgi:hypothetical protein
MGMWAGALVLSARLFGSPAAVAEEAGVRLAWSPVPGAIGYRIYVTQRSGDYAHGVTEDVPDPVPDGDGLIYHVVRQGVVTGVTNYFVVTSYDADDRESGYSNQLSLVPAVPPSPPSATAVASARPSPPATPTSPAATSTPPVPLTPTPTPPVEGATPTPRPSPPATPTSPAATSTSPVPLTPTPTPPVEGPTPTPTRRSQESCPGDCSGTGVVTVGDLAKGVGIALGALPVDRCPAFDTSGDAQVTVEEVIRAIGSALNGCPPSW